MVIVCGENSVINDVDLNAYYIVMGSGEELAYSIAERGAKGVYYHAPATPDMKKVPQPPAGTSPKVVRITKDQTLQIEGLTFLFLSGRLTESRKALLSSMGDPWVPYVVDYVVSHGRPSGVRIAKNKFIYAGNDPIKRGNDGLREIDNRISYRSWFIGGLPVDGTSEEIYTFLYNNIAVVSAATKPTEDPC